MSSVSAAGTKGKGRQVTPLVFCLGLAAGAAAADTAGRGLGSELSWLQEEVVVTTDRAPRRTETIPASVSVIGAEQIEQSGAQQVVDVLRHLAGVNVVDMLGNGRQARVDVRGAGINADASTLILVDGRRINGVAMFSTDWTTIPVERVARIEIVRGPGSVFYGNQAVAGVINIITKRGTVEKELRLGFDAGSHGYLKPYATYSGTTLLADAPLTFNLNASQADLDGYRVNSGLKLRTAGASASYEKGMFGLDLSVGYKHDDYGLTGGLAAAADRRSSTTPRDHATTEDTYLRAAPSLRLGEGNRLLLALDYRKTRPSFGSQFKDTVDQTGVSPQYLNERRFGWGRNKLTAGYDRLESQLKRASTFQNLDRKIVSSGWYAQDTLFLADETVALDLGYRRERFQFRYADARIDQSETLGASKLGVAWNYREGGKLFASLARAYRLQLIDEDGGGPVILRPQTSRHLDLGIGHRFGPGMELRATHYRVDTENEIAFDPTTFTNVNFARNRREGVEVEATAQIAKMVGMSLTLAQQDAAFLAGPYQGKQVPLTARSLGALGVNVVPTAGWWGDVKYRWVSGMRMDGDFTNVGVWKGSWRVVDAGVGYKNRRLTLTAGVRNLFNEKYAEYAYHLAPGALLQWPKPERTLYLNASLPIAF